jgi:adenosylcobinamide-GDP ribazoletransferase
VIHTPVRAVAAASAFLTRAPFVGRLAAGEDDLVRGSVVFPVVGAVIGGLIGAVAVAQVEMGIPLMLAGVVAVVVEVVITGALHVDGLADSVDGLAGRSPQHALAIMRDHSIGVYGTCALVLDLLVKVAVIAALPTSETIATLAAVYAVSRAAPLPLAAALPYAGSDGTGRVIVERAGWVHAAVGAGIAATVALVCVGLWALVLIGCLVAVNVVVGFASRRRLGGVSGDVLGASVELTAVAGLVAAVLWLT